MILTYTPNPAIDATMSLNEELELGSVSRLASVTRVAGGKGINVSHVAHKAGVATRALFPAHSDDPFVALLAHTEVPYTAINIAGSIRTNTTITEPSGRTTKLNGPGPELNDDERADVDKQLLHAIEEFSPTWVVLAGSLPPSIPDTWYGDCVKAIRQNYPGVKIAVDTSDAPMEALGSMLPDAAPDLIKPNGLELGQLAGIDGVAAEKAAEQGDYSLIADAARQMHTAGITNVLVTLGSAGALLTTADGSWIANPPPITVQSTVGAGDSALTGFILANIAGKTPDQCLRDAVAYGSAATALPGTTAPSPELLDRENTAVHAVNSAH
ncbi:1-phosphofructokinase family hexose kinase [Corynebacterium renale]|uniref:1-phosphofructokinase family hexose kinase n=1 Tax=Corynebacterium renale TaxID=1724 RepID=UPI000E02B42A|nr:1-phosphofructokinase family hexose kinase [Corynebacterium renale]STC96419.1 1-phosphofructokinase [Corynebacterium renale]